MRSGAARPLELELVEAARIIHGIDEREHAKGYNVLRSHNALGYRIALLEAIRGPVSKVKGPAGPLPAPTGVSPAPTTEYEQHHQNDQ